MNKQTLDSLIEIRKNIIKKDNHCLYDTEIAYVLTNCKDCKNKSMDREKCLDHKSLEISDLINNKN